jgi:putative DNA primase/helicase
MSAVMSNALERGQFALDSVFQHMLQKNHSILEQIDCLEPLDELPAGFSIMKDGVYYAKDDDAIPVRVCSPLRVTALVRDRSSENWGRLIEFNDADGVLHKWSLPMEMLGGDGADMRRELARQGLDIAADSRGRNKLTEYIGGCRPVARGRCVRQTGWWEEVFVMPDRTIGKSEEVVLFQAESTTGHYAQAGTLDQWRESVSMLCSGNSRLLFAVSAAFAGMILHHVGQDSGGLHFVGSSSTGKTTALQVAASVYGGASFVNNWRATSNGLEGLCSTHNDAALVLDELAQVDPRAAGEIVYMIGNGGGKARADRSGAARKRRAWRIIIISAGEIGLAQHMLDGGKVAKAGQEVRMIDIPADPGAGHGLFETLHGYSGGAALSDAIKEATKSCYGVASIAFLENLTAELRTAVPLFRNTIDAFIDAYLPSGAGGQAARVCRRFAVVACAGEYATDRGITGWMPGEATHAAVACFNAWLETRGGSGNQEREAILSTVKAFFESHGDARFTDMTVDNARVTPNRAGFRKATSAGPEYYVLTEAYRREVCHGHDQKTVTKVLLDAGWLIPGNDGKNAQKRSLSGMGETRCYVFSPTMWKM